MPTPIASQTRFGQQPIREVLFRRGITAKAFALSININPLHAIRANQGRITPAPIYVQRAAEALETPAAKLFTADARNAEYIGYVHKKRTPVDLLQKRAES